MGLADNAERNSKTNTSPTPPSGYMDPRWIKAYQQYQDRNRAETSSGYMDPKWQNPTAEFDTETYNIKQNSTLPSQNVAATQRQGQVNASIPTAVQPNPQPTGIDIGALYNDVRTRTDKYNADTAAGYDEALKRVQGNYDRSNAEMYQQYMNSRNQANEMAAGLGASQDIYNNWDSGIRRVQENSDLALADSLSFFDKMKAASGARYGEFLQAMENDRIAKETEQAMAILDYLAAQEAARNGGGGGRGGRGGGSSSGSITETAKQTDTVIDPEAYNTYLMLKATDPAAAATFYEGYLASTGSPAVKEFTTQIGNAATKIRENQAAIDISGDKPSDVRARQPIIAQNKVARENARKAQIARAAALGFSGLFNNPKSTQTVTTSAKDKK